jgi:ketosteroid isomerase-like protein
LEELKELLRNSLLKDNPVNNLVCKRNLKNYLSKKSKQLDVLFLLILNPQNVKLNNTIMKGNVIKGVLLSCLLSLLISCNTKKAEPEAPVIDIEQIKKEIQAKENDYAALYNSGEVKDIGYYAEDATTFYQNRAPLVGKTAIVEFLKSDLSSNSNKISFTTNEVFVSNDGNQVVEIGYYSVVDSTNTAINTGNYMSLFVKRDGKYVCLRDMSASDRPLE